MKFFLGGLLANADDNIVGNALFYERTVFGSVLNVIRLAGTGIALVMLTWMSINYFTADGRSFPGSIERKADIKGRQLANFAIGAGVFIGASNILYFVAKFVEDLMAGA